MHVTRYEVNEPRFDERVGAHLEFSTKSPGYTHGRDLQQRTAVHELLRELEILGQPADPLRMRKNGSPT